MYLFIKGLKGSKIPFAATFKLKQIQKHIADDVYYSTLTRLWF